jgi:hypothetical protein
VVEFSPALEFTFSSQLKEIQNFYVESASYNGSMASQLALCTGISVK